MDHSKKVYDEDPTESTFLEEEEDDDLCSSSCDNDDKGMNIVVYPSDEEGSSLSDIDDDSEGDDDDVSCMDDSEYLDRLEQSPHFVTDKTLPAPSHSKKVVCLSFLAPNISTSVATQVFEEAYRMLQPGGLLYVVDRTTVSKLPHLRQLLSRVSEVTPKQALHDDTAHLILDKHGFDASTGDDIVRWVGIKR